MSHPTGNPRTPPRVNDRCPCGSGRKYKHCHGAPRAAATLHGGSASIPTAAILTAARQAVAAGRLPDAQTAYLAVLGRELFRGSLAHSRPVAAADWRRRRHWWERLRSQAAYWLLTRVDPLLARRHLRSLG